jgi:hypothetical protein
MKKQTNKQTFYHPVCKKVISQSTITDLIKKIPFHQGESTARKKHIHTSHNTHFLLLLLLLPAPATSPPPPPLPDQDHPSASVLLPLLPPAVPDPAAHPAVPVHPAADPEPSPSPHAPQPIHTHPPHQIYYTPYSAYAENNYYIAVAVAAVTSPFP